MDRLSAMLHAVPLPVYAVIGVVLLPIVVIFGSLLIKILWGLWPIAFSVALSAWGVWRLGLDWFWLVALGIAAGIVLAWLWQRTTLFLAGDRRLEKLMFLGD